MDLVALKLVVSVNICYFYALVSFLSLLPKVFIRWLGF